MPCSIENEYSEARMIQLIQSTIKNKTVSSVKKCHKWRKVENEWNECGGQIVEDQKILELPQFLILALPRIHHDTGRAPFKRKEVCHLPQTLPLQADGGRDRTFKLYAVIAHHGEGFNSGHYTICIHHEGKWYHVNDNRSAVVSPKDIGKDSYLCAYMQ